MRLTAKVSLTDDAYWNWLGYGWIWGVRGDGLALADDRIFGGAEGVVVTCSIARAAENLSLRVVRRLDEYGHALWQPEDFVCWGRWRRP